MLIRFVLNHQPVEIESEPDRRVVDLLRQDLGLTGAKEGCGAGECGACTVLVDGVSRLSCLMLAAQLEGRELLTIEGFTPREGLDPIQAALVAEGGVQCGFCSPGMVLATADLLRREPRPDEQTIRRGLSGNLCRCTGYQGIVAAVKSLAPEDPA
jgi:carbon-monoxide dehydrogenase small subunit